MRADVVVVGAGIAGLACASELVERGAGDVVVLEAAARAGGPAETLQRGSYLLERGPNTVRANSELEQLAARAGLELVQSQRLAPAFVANGAIVALPPSLRALLDGTVLPLPGLLSVLAEPLRPVRSGPRSVRELVAERFGPLAAERLADLATLGVYGTSADRVGFEAAFPELAARLERAGGRFARLTLGALFAPSAPRRALVSTREGIGGLCQRLAARLGPRLCLNTPLRRARSLADGFELEIGASGSETFRCRRLVLALPPAAAARALELDSARSLLEGYASVPQVLASFALEDAAAAQRFRALGFLVPPRERLPLLGCLVPSNFFPDRAPDGALLLSVFVAPALQGAPDAALAGELAPVLQRLLGATRAPELLDVARWPEGIPLYDVGHPARTRALRERLAARGPLLCGAGYDGVAFAAAAASGVAAAHALAAS